MTISTLPPTTTSMTRSELSVLSKEQLIDRVLSLSNPQSVDTKSNPPNKKKKRERVFRPFDFGKYHQRRIAFKYMYLGWNYDGVAWQDHNMNTVEYHLFEALKQSRLIEDRDSCNFSRCGRTDKGVSAFCQVIALNVRTAMPPNYPGVFPFRPTETDVEMEAWDSSLHDDVDETQVELSYIKILNGNLPPDIRILQWSSVPPEFNARFDCSYRYYRYYFPRARYDIQAMEKAAAYFLGMHDFRNFCKFDPSKMIKSYTRKIIEARVEPSSRDSEMMVFHVKGSAFLWHQVRCMMAVLFLVGEGREKPEIVRELLDIELFPLRPQYAIAPEFPLVLWDCGYNEARWNIDFKGCPLDHHRIFKAMHGRWNDLIVRTAILETFNADVLLEGHASNVAVQPKKNTHGKTIFKTYPQMTDIERRHADIPDAPEYIPLAKRLVCGDEPLDDRTARFIAQRQLKRAANNDEVVEK